MLTLGHTRLCPGLRDHPAHLGPRSETRLPPRLNLGLRSTAGGWGPAAAQSSGPGCCCSVTNRGLATGRRSPSQGLGFFSQTWMSVRRGAPAGRPTARTCRAPTPACATRVTCSAPRTRPAEVPAPAAHRPRTVSGSHSCAHGTRGQQAHTLVNTRARVNVRARAPHMGDARAHSRGHIQERVRPCVRTALAPPWSLPPTAEDTAEVWGGPPWHRHRDL